MRRICVLALFSGALCLPAFAEPLTIAPASDGSTIAPAASAQPAASVPAAAAVRVAAAQPDLGGGFIQFLFGGGLQEGTPPADRPAPAAGETVPAAPQQTGAFTSDGAPDAAPEADAAADHPPLDPKYERQEVAYNGTEKPGTIIVDTAHKFLYLVEADGKALRYGIGVGREGFTWKGVEKISAKREWPDWRPPLAMVKRQPELPRFMAGGPENPLGARALYLGSTDYRIHGSNEPWTIGHNVSSGCIRMRNADVIDLYGRVNVGTTVVVM